MIYYGYKISTGEFVKSHEFYDEIPSPIPHKDIEWRLDAPVAPPTPSPSPEDVRAGKLVQIGMEGVKMASARKALILNNHLSTVNAALNAMQGVEGELARASFEYETLVRMDDTLALQMKGVLGLTQTQYEDLFIQALDL